MVNSKINFYVLGIILMRLHASFSASESSQSTNDIVFHNNTLGALVMQPDCDPLRAGTYPLDRALCGLAFDKLIGKFGRYEERILVHKTKLHPILPSKLFFYVPFNVTVGGCVAKIDFEHSETRRALLDTADANKYGYFVLRKCISVRENNGGQYTFDSDDGLGIPITIYIKGVSAFRTDATGMGDQSWDYE